MTEQEEMQQLLNRNQQANHTAQQKQTERRKANEIYREINKLEEKLISVRKQYSDYHSVLLKNGISDEHTKADFAQKMKEINKQIAALKNILEARKFRSPDKKRTWFGLSSEPKYIAIPNANDEYRTDLEGGSIRVIHRNDAGKIAAISMKDISRDPATSIKQVKEKKEDWDEYLKAHDKTKPLHIKSPSPAMNHYLAIYTAARHGQPTIIHPVLDGLSKIPLEQQEHAIIGAATCYKELYEELVKSDALSDQEKAALKAEIDTELGLTGKDFTNFLADSLNTEEKHDKLVNPSIESTIKQFFGKDEEFKKIVAEQFTFGRQLMNPNLANIFSKYYKKLDNGVSATFNTENRQSSAATLRAS